MTEQSDHTHINPEHLAGPVGCLAGIFGTRFSMFFLDYLCMKFDWGQRGHQLHTDHLVCRFCGNPIDLIGAWKCSCGFKRPGNYFGRCPKCLKHPIYIDCPVCGFTMDVR
jgi:hypothetical protein